MPLPLWIELAKVLPALAWVTLAAVLAHRLLPVVVRDVLPRMSGLKAFGVELNLARQAFDAAMEERGLRASAPRAGAPLRRAQTAAPALTRLRVLWVDDCPENNTNEVRMLGALGASVEQVTSTADALGRLRRGRYDVVLSDMARGSQADAGRELLREMRRAGLRQPVVFYVGQVDAERGTPPGAFAIADRPDDLLNFVIDVAERLDR